MIDKTKTPACILCGADALTPIMDFGHMPLPNRLPMAGDDPDIYYPLDLVLCQSCTLLQLGHIVPPEEMFLDYSYVPSTSADLRRHFSDLAQGIAREHHLTPTDLVVDIGSNDGLLLAFFKSQSSVRIMGIDPAANLAREAERIGVPTQVAFFDENVARLHRRTATVVTATNCLAHTANLRSYLRGVAEILKDDGVFIAEVPYVWSMLDGRLFDTVYHEHQSYFGLTALARQLPSCGLALVDAELVPVHGGSLRITCRPMRGSADLAPTRRLAALVDAEENRAPAQPASYGDFAYAVAHLSVSIRMQIERLKGSVVAGFGASAKAAVILNYCGIYAEDMAFVADANPLKQGRMIPGMRIPIVAEARLAEADYIVNFIWNLPGDVRDKLGRIAPNAKVVNLLPTPEIVDARR